MGSIIWAFQPQPRVSRGLQVAESGGSLPRTRRKNSLAQNRKRVLLVLLRRSERGEELEHKKACCSWCLGWAVPSVAVLLSSDAFSWRICLQGPAEALAFVSRPSTSRATFPLLLSTPQRPRSVPTPLVPLVSMLSTSPCLVPECVLEPLPPYSPSWAFLFSSR